MTQSESKNQSKSLFFSVQTWKIYPKVPLDLCRIICIPALVVIAVTPSNHVLARPLWWPNIKRAFQVYYSTKLTPVPRVDYKKLSGNKLRESSDTIRQCEQAARDIQNKSFLITAHSTSSAKRTCASRRCGNFAGCRLNAVYWRSSRSHALRLLQCMWASGRAGVPKQSSCRKGEIASSGRAPSSQRHTYTLRAHTDLASWG